MATVGYGVKYHCHSNNNNNNISIRKKRRLLISSLLTFAVWSFLTLTNNNNVAVQSAAVYSNVDFLANPIFEPLCALQQERFIESEGKESSVILEFNAKDVNEKTTKSCKRILSAPSAYGFIVRLILPKIRHHHHHQHHHVQAQQQPQKQRQPQKQQATMKTLVAGGGHASDVTLNGAKLSGKNKMATVAALSEMTSLFEKLNGTATQQLKTSSSLGRACPLSVFSSHDPHTPQWRVDPCQLEDTAPEMEDPVRLFHGRLRIVWEHGHQELDSKLMVTVLGKGDECRSDTKHQCLKIGDEPILCISKDLVCDGIRHCPNSNEYDSDEDYAMCWQRRRFGEPMPVVGSEIFEHFALEVFRNLFAFDVPGGVVKAGPEGEAATTTTQAAGDAEAAAAAKSTTTLRKVNTKQMTGENSVEKEANEGDNNSVNKGEREDEKDGDSSSESDSDASNSTATQGTQSSLDNSTSTHRRNSTRLGLNSDLSKYGPWGYLMLGMLLCGGALLICGLWASATQHAANNERESNLQHGSGAANSSISNEHTSNGAPPNYEELDPPPSYAALFPNQKAASSTTLNSLSTATAAALAVATVAATATAIASVPSEGVNRRTTPVTQVQLESQASGSSSRGASSHATS